jgi:SsrA-binding protein
LATHVNHDPNDKRKLLLNKKEILKLKHKKKAENLTYVAASVYFTKKNLLKVSIAVVKGIRKQDKREHEKSKEHKKELKKYY